MTKKPTKMSNEAYHRTGSNSRIGYIFGIVYYIFWLYEQDSWTNDISLLS